MGRRQLDHFAHVAEPGSFARASSAQQGGVHAVLALNAIRGSPFEARLQVRPIGTPPLATTLWIATSAQRPRGPLIEQSTALVKDLLVRLWT
jgi:LysR family nitrogen assimilation transcriptional regulator